MVSTDDSDGCTTRLGQRGMSEQGGENQANSRGALEEKRTAESLPSARKYNHRLQEVGGKKCLTGSLGSRVGRSKKRYFASKTGRTICLNIFF